MEIAQKNLPKKGQNHRLEEVLWRL